MSDRLNLSVYANDIFNQNENAVSAIFPGGSVYTSSKWDTRSFGISVNYKIPTKNKLAKVDQNLINTNQKDDNTNGNLLQQGQ